jgi:hypothetical protein
MNSHVFISHSSKDDAFVRDLSTALEGFGLKVRTNPREPTGGMDFQIQADQAIKEASQFIAVIGVNTLESSSVRHTAAAARCRAFDAPVVVRRGAARRPR